MIVMENEKRICNCGEREATYLAVPTRETIDEYPESEWFFCDECVFGIIEGVFSGGGPFASDFTSFHRLANTNDPVVIVALSNAKHIERLERLVKQVSGIDADLFDENNYLNEYIGRKIGRDVYGHEYNTSVTLTSEGETIIELVKENEKLKKKLAIAGQHDKTQT